MVFYSLCIIVLAFIATTGHEWLTQYARSVGQAGGRSQVGPSAFLIAIQSKEVEQVESTCCYVSGERKTEGAAAHKN